MSTARALSSRAANLPTETARGALPFRWKRANRTSLPSGMCGRDRRSGSPPRSAKVPRWWRRSTARSRRIELFCWNRHACFLALVRPIAPEPGLQPSEIEIDDRRRVERQKLRQRQAADHGIAERLAEL